MSTCKITHSLLSSWQYATNADATQDKWESFLSTLHRKPIKDNKAMADGRLFESMVNAVAAGERVECDNEKWLNAARLFGKRCKGGIQQVKIGGLREYGGQLYRLVGVADVVKAGRIYDIKKVVRYEYGKYYASTQHPVYFELMPHATRFDYLIFDGYMCYNETYRRGDFTPIGTTIKEFERFLKDTRLWETYKLYWED